MLVLAKGAPGLMNISVRLLGKTRRSRKLSPRTRSNVWLVITGSRLELDLKGIHCKTLIGINALPPTANRMAKDQEDMKEKFTASLDTSLRMNRRNQIVEHIITLTPTPTPTPVIQHLFW